MAKREKSKKRSGESVSKRLGTNEPIFGKDVSNIIPGELLVQLHEDLAANITTSISKGPTRGLTQGASTFGVDDLDSVLADLQVTSISRLHPPAPISSAAMEIAVPMASTFRMRFDSTKPPLEAAEQLERLKGVEFAEPNYYRETCVVPNDPSYASQWGLAKINCPAAWDRTTGSANVIVAVIDSGVDLNHPELAPLIVPGTDMVDLGPNPTPPSGFHFEGDFQGRDNDPQDEVGHGTHVAGTIACLSNNGVGVAGVTWGCRIMPVRVLARIVNNSNASDVRGAGSSADIAAGIRWAVDSGARVLNLSLTGTQDAQVERDAIAYAIAHGAVVVAAMGNAFKQGNPTSFPAAYPDVVAVGAIDQSDHRAGFSQTGPHIDVSGPGVGVLSTVWDNGYATMSGTSMATPHVAGVAALVLSCNSNLTGQQVADILRQTARPLRDNPGDPVPNDNYGFGCVDAQAAVNRACPRITTLITCRPSVVIRCPSIQIRCPTETIICRPSVVIRCPSIQIRCRTEPIICRPSAVIATCPRPSLTIRCPSGVICGSPIDQPGSPVQGQDINWARGYNPYEWSNEDWEGYDPYSTYYGDENEGSC